MSRLRKSAALIAAVGAAAAAVLAPFVDRWESGDKPRLVAYRDIVGVVTICGGDTSNVKMGDVETVEGCALREERQLIRHAEPVKRCTPGIVGRPHAFAAAISLTYNIGGPLYCKSTVARRFNAGDIAGACDAFRLFNRATYPRPQPGKVCTRRADGRFSCVERGLDNRRREEAALCRKDLP